MKTKTAIENLLSFLKGFGSVRSEIPVDMVINKALEYQKREYANQSKWMSISDRMPDDQTECLVYDEKTQSIYVTFFWGNEWKYAGEQKTYPTHWQPLPTPPTNPQNQKD